MANGKATIPWPEALHSKEMKDRVASAKVLAVGAGGIGCELLKSLVVSGFRNIEVIDLDTIEVSNLNRQFLFRKHHVGHSKASVAAEAVRRICPDATITAHHANVKESRFDIDFFRQFDLVLNGLDNLDARRHVNRMCLAAKVPLVESGTAGYLGQTSVHVGGVTECFDCQPKPTQKSYAVCTIRTSPDKPIHCIVWAKELLFARLFGPREESDVDVDVEGKMIRAEGESAEAYADRVFDVAFNDNIKKVLEAAATSEEDMFKGRDPPKPLDLAALKKEFGSAQESKKTNGNTATGAASALGLSDQNAVWSVAQNAAVFLEATQRMLNERASELGSLVFDKDDDLAVEFVTAAANLRGACYHISSLSLFDAKGMAGNIIHAIATTNAIIAGLVVQEALKLLAAGGDPLVAPCRCTFLQKEISARRLLAPVTLESPNPACVVCGTARLEVRLDTFAWTFGDFVNKVLKGRLNLVISTVSFGVNSDAMFDYEEDDDMDEKDIAKYAAHLPKKLADLPAGGMVHGTVVELRDARQKIKMELIVSHQGEWDEEKTPEMFTVAGKVPEAKEEEDVGDAAHKESAEVPVPMLVGKKRSKAAMEDEDGVFVLVDDDEDGQQDGGDGGAGPSKKRKIEENGDNDDEVILLD